ncbi:hypothetical protein [Pseudoalteromonas galatheae]|uniref:hypothetical protein n=1 Tax=Pseudoalteromonas galatheae TaxID=579562 RepID=UPI0030D2ADFD
MSKQQFLAVIDALSGIPTVNKRGCELCEDEKSVGKYYVTEEENPDACGWWRVCSNCASMVANVGADVQYYKYSKEYKDAGKSDLPDNVQLCDHEWDKHSLVSEHCRKRDRVFDWMKCTKCGCYGKRLGLDHYNIVDLTMEIDLSCSR